MFVKLLILIICFLHPELVPLWREENYQAQCRLLHYLHKFLSYLHKCDHSQMVGLDSSFLYFFLTEFIVLMPKSPKSISLTISLHPSSVSSPVTWQITKWCSLALGISRNFPTSLPPLSIQHEFFSFYCEISVPLLIECVDLNRLLQLVCYLCVSFSLYVK